jgi:hypothetical protein
MRFGAQNHRVLPLMHMISVDRCAQTGADLTTVVVDVS